MSTYKVIQDIEAEDKLLGPLTLRQFVYAAIVIVLLFISFKLLTSNPFLILPFLPPIIFFGMLAAPFGHDQSSEVWLLAKIRFFLKPRRRIWDQTGIEELVTITVPKVIEKQLTDNLSQVEVKSRLRALANTLDSRGWAVKNVDVNLFSQPSYVAGMSGSSDRLIDGSNLPQDVPMTNITAADDILDPLNNPAAQQLQSMINQSEQTHRQTLLSTVQGHGGTPQNQNWFMQPGAARTDDSQTADEQAVLERIHREKAKPNQAYGHTRVLQPVGNAQTHSASSGQTKGRGQQHKARQSGHTSQSTGRTDNNPAANEARATLQRLAANDDLNVATIAREADRATKPPNDEVVINLH